MDEAAIRRYITDTFTGVETVEAAGASFFFCDSDHMFPFATLVTNDEHDRASDLNRPGVFRLNVGVGKQTFQSLFAPGTDGGHDFTALDRVMPHPVYGKMYWVCVLSPSDDTFKAVRPLLAEAHQLAVRRRAGAKPAGES